MVASSAMVIAGTERTSVSSEGSKPASVERWMSYEAGVPESPANVHFSSTSPVGCRAGEAIATCSTLSTATLSIESRPDALSSMGSITSVAVPAGTSTYSRTCFQACVPEVTPTRVRVPVGARASHGLRADAGAPRPPHAPVRGLAGGGHDLEARVLHGQRRGVGGDRAGQDEGDGCRRGAQDAQGGASGHGGPSFRGMGLRRTGGFGGRSPPDRTATSGL
ncbi:hypothetical protein ASD19_01665 [Microbacterium sp. Root53]|nr:hypothetical protein ASD19_01665 [Microbacterium sp. Root53]